MIGEILHQETIKTLRKMALKGDIVAAKLVKGLKPMKIEPTHEQLSRGYISKIEKCGCGSGKLFRLCCGRQ